MSIVAAAVVPHSPLLLPSIAKEHASAFSCTLQALQGIGEYLYATQPDLLIILTPHGESNSPEFVVHVAETYHGTFTTFGDFSTTCSALGSPGAAHRLKMTAEHEHCTLQLQTHDELDYGTSVPILTVLPPLKEIPVLPIIHNHQDVSGNLRFGQLLYEHCTSERVRVGIIASADLTRRKPKESSAGERPSSEEKKISQSITAVDPSIMAALTPKPNTCGYGPILTLLAAVQHIHPQPSITSFQAPLGVGLLTAIFRCNG